MPTPVLMILPKSKSAEEFEIICKDVLSEIYGKIFTQYGRPGQKQHGIDIYSRDDDDLFIVAQCKNYYEIGSSRRLIEQMKIDIAAAPKSGFDIKSFIAMTSLNRDTTVQNAFKMSRCVRTIFWEEIQETVCSNNRLLLKHYPSFFIDMLTPIEIQNQIIGHLNTIGNYAFKFLEKRNYRVCYNEQTNIRAYKDCIAMFSEACDLYNIMCAWNLQLDKLGILEPIKEIVESMPKTYDESEDELGTSIIITIQNYIRFFCEKENYDAFTKNLSKADKIIREHSKSL